MKLKPNSRYRLDLDTKSKADFDYFEVLTNEVSDLAMVELAPGQTWAWQNRLISTASIVVGGFPQFINGESKHESYLLYPITAITAI